MKEELDERVKEEELERDAWMADPFTLDVTLSTLNSTNSITPPVIDTSDVSKDITLSSDFTSDADVIVMEVSVKVPALTEKRGQLSGDADVSVKVMEENVTALLGVDAMNAPEGVPERDFVCLVTAPSPLTVKEWMEGSVSDVLSAM